MCYYHEPGGLEMKTQLDRYVGVRDVWESLGVTRQTAYRWVWSREIPSVKVGGKILIPVTALNEKLATREVQSTGKAVI